ncbi:ribonuclease T2 family protein [Sphingomonas bacterium]|uniref:ribonuclease T2 family protein n=1 Tax=Sphingomonas bacterium TaxID=1895847 RepID=UPI0015765EB4|nr:ribonuclease T [Sphingomonas bacterium]
MLPTGAVAQALSCSLPAQVERPHPELPSASQPQRLLPTGGYTLAVTWAPEYCHMPHNGASDFECGQGNRFGFVLHGLWPDGVGKDWPQYCRSTPLLAPATIRANLCSTPSAQLLQHEWAKHGTCMAGLDPDSYFRRSTGLYAKLRYPDMAALSREQGLTVGRLAEALAAANPGLPASAVRVTLNRLGWLDELWLCLDRQFAYERCRPDSGGAVTTAALKIWRGGPARPRLSPGSSQPPGSDDRDGAG